jgi:4'-phosphopantetheinyl transferase
MMDVSWLEQTAADLPEGNDWLSANEAVRLDGMRFPKRRADWRLGRWTAKRALAIYLDLPAHARALADIELRPAPSGAPEVFVANQAAAVTVSLSHRAGVASCAVALPEVELGCDLEVVEPRSAAFLDDYFTRQEKELVERTSPEDRLRLLALLWSAKESALKALRTGLRLDTRSVEVSVVPPWLPGDEYLENRSPIFTASSGSDAWQPLQVVYGGAQIFLGWWQNTGNLMRTMVASPPPSQPIFLQTPVHSVPNAS